MCSPHWQMVPEGLQRAIWRTHRHGPRREYLAHVRDAVGAVERQLDAKRRPLQPELAL